MKEQTKFTLPKLNNSYTAFEPYIDAKTMETHYEKHHNTYIQNLNIALQYTAPTTLTAIIQNISKYNVTIRNNAGGHFNHTFFWEILSPKSAKKPGLTLNAAIEKQFNSFENFKKEFTHLALKHFGSGWVWLGISKKNDELFLCSTPNQDNPLMDIYNKNCRTLLLGLDVWEHAYYLKYQNKKADYIEAFWNIIDWESIEKKYINK